VQYVLYGPLVGKAVASRAWEAASPDRWILLLLVLFGLRALTYQLWSSFSNMLFATRRRRILRDGVDYDQIDREWDWYVDRCPSCSSSFFFPRPAHHADQNICVARTYVRAAGAPILPRRDNFLIPQILMAATALYVLPSLRHLPLWDARGLAVAALVHVAVTEPLFYAVHRAFHSGHLYASYHSLHHSIKVPQPFTGTYISFCLCICSRVGDAAGR
jgi:hypothetical protein